MPVEFAELTQLRVQALPREKTVFFLPIGPLEDHGPHLRVSLDLEEARALSLALAERMERELPGWVGVLLPAIPLAVEGNTTELALTVRGYVLRDWLVDTCRSLHRFGFHRFACVSGHLGPRQLTAIEDAAKTLSFPGNLWLSRLRAALTGVRTVRVTAAPTLVSVCSALVPPGEAKRSPFWPTPPEHGGKRDTSVALAIGSPLAGNLSDLKAQDAPAASPWAHGILRYQRKVRDYWGSPAQGTREQGERLLREAVDAVYPKLRAHWEGANPNYLFRSWYSVLPPNKTNLMVWVLTLAVLILLAAWLRMGMDITAG